MSTFKEGAIWHRHTSTLAQNKDLLWVSWFYSDILHKTWDEVGHQKTGIDINIACNMLSNH